MQNKKLSAFSLIELLLAILIVAGATATMLKQFSSKKKYPLKEVIAECQSAMQNALINAMNQKKVIAVHFYFDEHGALTHIGQVENNHKTNEPGQNIQKKIINYPVVVKSFVVNGKDEMQSRSKQIWILVYPEGYLQEISFSLQEQNKESIMYEVNPFTGVIDYAS